MMFGCRSDEYRHMRDICETSHIAQNRNSNPRSRASRMESIVFGGGKGGRIRGGSSIAQEGKT